MAPFHLYLYGPSKGPIATSFEEAEARLLALPMLHFEPDGSFIWTRHSGEHQLCGIIYDAASEIRYCDIRGQCNREMWRELCSAITGQGCDSLEVMLLPNRQLQDLQSFEKNAWPDQF